MASLFTNQTLPKTSEEAIREFDQRYLALASAGPVSTWASGFETSVGAPRVTYPLSAFAVKFRETKEQSGRFKSMEEKSFDLRVVEYDEGFEAPFAQITMNVFAYRNWSRAPEAMRQGEARHVARQLATALEAGTAGTNPWDNPQSTVAFFGTAHLCNPLDAASATWSNYNSAGVDPAVIANLQAEMTSMRKVLDVNGDKLGVDPDTIWLPTEKFQVVSDLLNQARLANGADNPLKGRLTPVHIPELTDVNDWYLADSKLIAMGYDPMIALSHMPAETLGFRYYDESSDFFKDTGKLKVSQHIWKAFSLLMPHGIRRVAGA